MISRPSTTADYAIAEERLMAIAGMKAEDFAPVESEGLTELDRQRRKVLMFTKAYGAVPR